MRRPRWLLLTFALPLVYTVILFWAARPAPPIYTLPGRIVMDVTAPAGPAALHTVDPIYPPAALRQKLEGTVKLQVTIAADGSVTSAVPLSGPAQLREAAVAAVRQWQFAAKADQAPIEIPFALRNPTTSLAPPHPVPPAYPPAYPPASPAERVRLVAMIDPEGRVEFVQPVSGPDSLIPAAVAAVRQWTFTPPLRNGEPTHATAVIDLPQRP